jgi:hypothetical protein
MTTEIQHGTEAPHHEEAHHEEGRRPRPRQARAARRERTLQEAQPLMDARRLLPQLGAAGVVALALWQGLGRMEDRMAALQGDVREMRVQVDALRERDRQGQADGIRLATLEAQFKSLQERCNNREEP